MLNVHIYITHTYENVHCFTCVNIFVVLLNKMILNKWIIRLTDEVPVDGVKDKKGSKGRAWS